MSTINKFAQLNMNSANKFQSVINTSQSDSILENLSKSIGESPELMKLVSLKNREVSKKYGMFFNPANDSELCKFYSGCDSCVTLTEIVLRICQTYGCVSSQFVTSRIARDCANQKIFSVVGVQKEGIFIQSSGAGTYQKIHDAIDQDSCGDMAMLPFNLQETIWQSALCSCTPFDAVVEAAELLAQQYAYVYDKAILYGAKTTSPYALSGGATGTIVYPFSNTIGGMTNASGFANTNFQSILPNLLPINNPAVIGVNDMYDTIIKMITQVKFGGDCGDTNIMMTSAMATALHSMKDNNGTPILREMIIGGSGLCSQFSIACTPVIICDAPEEFTINGSNYSDIWIGSKSGFAFSSFNFSDAVLTKDINSTNMLLQSTQYAGGKLLKPEKFAKITVKLN